MYEKDYSNWLMDQYYQTIIQDTPEPDNIDDNNESNVTMQEWIELMLLHNIDTKSQRSKVRGQ